MLRCIKWNWLGKIRVPSRAKSCPKTIGSIGCSLNPEVEQETASGIAFLGPKITTAILQRKSFPRTSRVTPHRKIQGSLPLRPRRHVHNSLEPTHQRRRAPKFMLPHPHGFPAPLLQFRIDDAVTLFIALQLGRPEIPIARRNRPMRGAAVPKASVYKNGHPYFGKYKVRMAENLGVATPAGKTVASE